VRELDVDVTVAAPKRHGPSGFLHHPRAKIFVRHKQQILLFRRGINDLDGVAAGANDVGEGLHFGAAIDVGDGVKIWIGLLKGLELVGRAAFLERTARVFIGQQDELVRVKDLGGLGHEVDAAKHDDFRFGFGGLLREAQRIAHVIGHILDLRHLVIVRENDRVELALKVDDFPRKRIEPRRRNGCADLKTVNSRRRHGDDFGHR
jgi:hypothetical protein